ncbi:MAG: adenine deaminase [marine bacterium B5-7]|nr:MAG: adenine deaminase [marine bacterium B5-7]
MQISSFISALPKAELHLHIEGTFEPELMLYIADRNGIDLQFDSVDSLRAAYNFSNLQDFLDIYYQGMNVLLTEEDFYDLTLAYIERVGAQAVRHVEIFFDPQAHTARGIVFKTVIDGIWRALETAREKFDISSNLILCFLRHLDEADAIATLHEALPYRDRITAVGLDSSESGHPPSKFERVFALAREAGFYCVAHAGEEGPPDYVVEALDLLKVSRIDHGNRALEDHALTRRLAKEKIPMTVCPLSNHKLCVVKDLDDHPLPTMLEAGLMVTLNSDDPAFFGGYINENFQVMKDHFDLSNEVLGSIARNSFLASFMSGERRSLLLDELDAYMAGST